VATKLYSPQDRIQGYIDFDKYKEIIFQKPDFEGYMEFEAWTDTIQIPWTEYDPEKASLFLPNLEPTNVEGNDFKVADVHFTARKIDKDLGLELLAKGFYYADFNDKIQRGEMHRVFTIQTAKLQDAKRIQEKVLKYIEKVGGFEGECFLEPVLKYVRTKNHPVPPRSSVKIDRN
jgi:hypothetical protein